MYLECWPRGREAVLSPGARWDAAQTHSVSVLLLIAWRCEDAWPTSSSSQLCERRQGYRRERLSRRQDGYRLWWGFWSRGRGAGMCQLTWGFPGSRVSTALWKKSRHVVSMHDIKHHARCARVTSPLMILVILSDSASISWGLLWMVVILEKSGPERFQQNQKR